MRAHSSSMRFAFLAIRAASDARTAASTGLRCRLSVLAIEPRISAYTIISSSCISE